MTGGTTLSSTLNVTGQTTFANNVQMLKTSPVLQLTSSDDTNTTLQFQTSASGALSTDGVTLYLNNSNNFYICNKEAANVCIQTAGTTRQTINSAGTVAFTGAGSFGGTLSATGNITSSGTIGGLSSTVLTYLSTVSSDVQTQLGSLFSLSGGSLTGDVVVVKVTPTLTLLSTDE